MLNNTRKVLFFEKAILCLVKIVTDLLQIVSVKLSDVVMVVLLVERFVIGFAGATMAADAVDPNIDVSFVQVTMDCTVVELHEIYDEFIVLFVFIINIACMIDYTVNAAR